MAGGDGAGKVSLETETGGAAKCIDVRLMIALPLHANERQTVGWTTQIRLPVPFTNLPDGHPRTDKLRSIELGAGGGLVGYVSVVKDQSTRQDYQILKTEASKSRSKRPANTENTVFTDYASRLAIALGCSPTQPIHITDQSYMIPLMNRNIVLNNLTSQQIRASTYDWGSSARPAELPAQANVILAADCVYFEPAFPLLLKTLEDLLESEQTTCYFCFKRRRRADMQFLKAAKKRFEVVDVPNDPDEAIWRRENIYL